MDPTDNYVVQVLCRDKTPYPCRPQSALGLGKEQRPLFLPSLSCQLSFELPHGKWVVLVVEVWTLKTRTCTSVNIGDTGVDLAGELRTWNARVETCKPRITRNDLRINLMMGQGGPCVRAARLESSGWGTRLLSCPIWERPGNNNYDD